MKHNDNRLGVRVRELRKIRGWSQRELAVLTDTNEKAVGRDEREGRIGIKRIGKYATAFGVQPELILEILDDGEEE